MIILKLTVMTLFSIIIPEVIRYHLAYSNSDFKWYTDQSKKILMNEPRDNSIGISSNVFVFHVNYEGNKELVSIFP